MDDRVLEKIQSEEATGAKTYRYIRRSGKSKYGDRAPRANKGNKSPRDHREHACDLYACLLNL